MGLLRKEDLLRPRLKAVEVEIAALGGSVRLRDLPARARLAFTERAAATGASSTTIRDSLCLALQCVVDEDDGRMFAEDEIESVTDRLMDDDLDTVLALVKAAFEVLGLTKEATANRVAGFTEGPS